MDRAAVDKLLANARRRETVTVWLPVCGDELCLFAELTSEEQLRVATASGGDEDADARAITGMLRFMLVDPADHKPLLRSFAEAAAFMSALDPSDMGVVLEEFHRLGLAAQAAQTVEDPEPGKAS